MKEILQDLHGRPLEFAQLHWWIVDLPQKEPFQSALGWRQSRQALFLAVEDLHGNLGLGECGCRPDPFFSHEFVQGALCLVRQYLVPVFFNATTYGELLAGLSRIRGWNFVKAALLDAVHDCWRRDGMADPLDLWSGERRVRVPVGISLGLFDSVDSMLEKVSEVAARGYRRVKLKIAPALPRDYLAVVREAFPDLYLGVDANGSFDECHLEWLARLEDLGLAMIEQPFAPDRLDLCAQLKCEAPALRICLDESVAEMGHLRVAHRLGAIDELNLKPGRVGGSLAVIEMAEFCRERDIPIWVGGMFETGVGRALNLRVASRFPEALGHDLSPSARYFAEDIVLNPLTMDDEGCIFTSDDPVQMCTLTVEKYTTFSETVSLDHA